MSKPSIKFLLLFCILIAGWFLVGASLLQSLTSRFGVLASYSMFLLIYLFLAYKLGFILNIGRGKIVVVALIMIIVPDILLPPYLFSYDKLPSEEILNLTSSDTFMYLVWQRATGLSHGWLWFLTYAGTTILGVLLLVWILGLKPAVRTFGERVLDGVPKIR